MSNFSRPTDEAIAQFERYVANHLKQPCNASRHVEALIGTHDWSRSLTVEIRGFYCQDGNPTTYTFVESDMIEEDIDV